MEIIAVGDKIIVQEIKEDDFEKTDSGIYVPEQAQNNMKPYLKATVISVGKEISEVKAGDVIFTAKNWGQSFQIDKETYRTYGLGEIFGVVRGKE